MPYNALWEVVLTESSQSKNVGREGTYVGVAGVGGDLDIQYSKY